MLDSRCPQEGDASSSVEVNLRRNPTVGQINKHVQPSRRPGSQPAGQQPVTALLRLSANYGLGPERSIAFGCDPPKPGWERQILSIMS